MGLSIVESCLQKLRMSQILEERIKSLEQLGDLAPTSASEKQQIAECLSVNMIKEDTMGLKEAWKLYGCTILSDGWKDIRKRSMINILVSSCVECEDDKDPSRQKWHFLFLQAAKQQLLSTRELPETFSLHIELASKILKWYNSLLLKIVEDPLQCEASISALQKLQDEMFLYAKTIYSNLETCSFLLKPPFIYCGEEFIHQSLNLIKAACLNDQKLDIAGGLQRSGPELLSLSLKVILIFHRKVSNMDIPEDREAVSKVVALGVQMLVELGKLAAKGGKNLLAILNMSWKAVSALLTENGQKPLAMSGIIDVRAILSTLISCASDSLKDIEKLCPHSLGRESPSSSKDTDFKKLCIPVKFFLINAVRIASSFPREAIEVGRHAFEFASEAAALKLALGSSDLAAAAEALVEIVEPTSLALLHCILCTPDIEATSKANLLEEFCSPTRELDGATVRLGRFALFVDILQAPWVSTRELAVDLGKKLDWLLEGIAEDSLIYSSVVQVHVCTCAGKPSWRLFYLTILQSLETFLVSTSVSTSGSGWAEVERFLFRNAFHPNVLCHQLVLDLWCFVACHGGAAMLADHLVEILALMDELSSSGRGTPLFEYPMKCLARIVSSIARWGPEGIVGRVHELALGSRDVFAAPSSVSVAAVLLSEGFPTDSLPSPIRRALLLKSAQAFSETPMSAPNGAAVAICLSELLSQCGRQNLTDGDFQKLVEASSTGLEACLADISGGGRKLSSPLSITSALDLSCKLRRDSQLNDIKGVLIGLHKFVKGSPKIAEEMMDLKPAVAELLASLSESSIVEEDSNPVSEAVWELYHLVLKEKHWALVHVGLASFGYFAARTPCVELWRFLPSDAAMAYDVASGSSASEDNFMSALRGFLEKEDARASLATTKEELELLKKESRSQRELQHAILVESVGKLSDPDRIVLQDGMDIDQESNPNCGDNELNTEIEQAMGMLHKGLSLLKQKLPSWVRTSGLSTEHQHQVQEQLSLLTDIITQLDVL